LRFVGAYFVRLRQKEAPLGEFELGEMLNVVSFHLEREEVQKRRGEEEERVFGELCEGAKRKQKEKERGRNNKH
jgi:hypothetical protein